MSTVLDLASIPAYTFSLISESHPLTRPALYVVHRRKKPFPLMVPPPSFNYLLLPTVSPLWTKDKCASRLLLHSWSWPMSLAHYRKTNLLVHIKRLYQYHSLRLNPHGFLEQHRTWYYEQVPNRQRWSPVGGCDDAHKTMY